jgi:uncharacterized membrane protein
MALIGRMHPLLIHFPIALVLAAAAAEIAAIVTGNERWRVVAVGNLRSGAAVALVAALAGWRLAMAPNIEPSALLEWHRWLGVMGAGSALAAAVATSAMVEGAAPRVRMYQAALFAAGMLMIATGHLGGVMVWGADFLHP